MATNPARPGQLHSRRGAPILRWGCVFLLMFPFVLGLSIIMLTTAVTFTNGPWVFTLAAVLASATAVPYGLLLIWLDRNEPEPMYLVVAAFVWGAVFATGY